MSAQITASVGQKAHNRPADVRTVQDLLNRVPPHEGGPLQRLSVDGLCYAKTLAAIGRFQKMYCGFQWPDHRVDPGKRTWQELSRHGAPASGRETITCFPAGEEDPVYCSPVQAGLAPGAPVSAQDLIAQAIGARPLASVWVTATLAKLMSVRSMIERFHVYTPEEIASFAPIETHFKVRIPAKTDMTSKARIDRIIRTYQRIQQVLGGMPANLVGNPAKSFKAEAPLGGFDHAGERITIGRDFANANLNMRAAVLIHESAHFVDAAITHAASELPAPDGSPIVDSFGKRVNPGGLNYRQLGYRLAIQNAYAFAQCALHNGVGVDKRPP